MKVILVNSSIPELSRQINHLNRYNERSSSLCTHTHIQKKTNRNEWTMCDHYLRSTCNWTVDRDLNFFLLLLFWWSIGKISECVWSVQKDSSNVELIIKTQRETRKERIERKNREREQNFWEMFDPIWSTFLSLKHTHIRSLEIMACDLHVINKIIASFSLDFEDDDDDDISHRSIYLYVYMNVKILRTEQEGDV